MAASIWVLLFWDRFLLQNHYPRFRGAPFCFFRRPLTRARSVDWDLTLGQLDATYSYLVGQEPATFLLGPAPAGSFYSAADLRPTSYFWQAGTDPYTVDPDKPRRSSIPVRVSLPVPRSEAVPWTVADTWEVDGTSFRIEADISEVIEDLGPGVYTLFIWGTKGGETVHLTNYSIFLE